jgi:hypothetical protein
MKSYNKGSNKTPHRKRRVRVDKKDTKEPIQRWTQGHSTYDGQPCDAWFNVTNWP